MSETARLMAELDALMEAALEERIAADSAVPDDPPADLQLDDAEPRHRMRGWERDLARHKWPLAGRGRVR